MAKLPGWLTPDAVDTVVVAFPDTYGRLMGKRLTRQFFIDQVVEAGTHVCNYLLTVDIEMNPLPGFSLANWDKGYGDFHVVIDPKTLRLLPWAEKTAMVIGDLYHEDHSPVAEAPRTVLKTQLERLRKRGLVAKTASELEFYLFDNSYSEAHAADYRKLTPSSDYLIDYHLLQTGRDEGLMRQLRNELSEAGIVVEGTKGEWGKGQHELNLVYCDALEMADRHVLLKHGTKEIAAQHGRSITFMAKWATEEAGSSCHIHTSLWSDGANASNGFADGNKPSKLFSQFLGGMLRYGREFCYFFAPTINAYKRYQAASWAPTSLTWALDNRTTGFRVVGSGPSLRIENRMPGADVNPYLAFAATIAAGLRGIEENLECGEPYRGNAYEDADVPRLPPSLSDAIDLLDQSAVAREALGDQVVDFYCHSGRSEVAAHMREVSTWERRRYFERL